MITSNQANKLEVKSHSQISPYLEACCLRISASVSYERTTEEIKYLTEIEISKSAQQRLVHRQEFELPQTESVVAELSVDGGNIRVQTPEGEPSSWKGYKATVLHENFCAYLEKHRHRIINYCYFQAAQICSIGSGAIESTIKQIDRRPKISLCAVEG